MRCRDGNSGEDGSDVLVDDELLIRSRAKPRGSGELSFGINNVVRSDSFRHISMYILRWGNGNELRRDEEWSSYSRGVTRSENGRRSMVFE